MLHEAKYLTAKQSAYIGSTLKFAAVQPVLTLLTIIATAYNN
jgi:hypothetical protein